MQKEAARKLIQDTLERPFDKDQFTVFIKNLLNHLEHAPFPRPRTGQMIFADYRNDISTLDRVGKYIDGDGRKLDVLIVKLTKSTSLERARSKLRNFVAKYLKESQGGQNKDAALVAFVSPNEEDWRFSFVKMEYKFDTTKKGQPKVTEQFTPAKRYSFLVGENENSHTAQSRLLPILENTDNDPSLSNIEEAFSIEKVTKEFFEKYRDLFLEIKEALDQIAQQDKAISVDFQEKGIDTVDFAKKLLGQIVFLYFLQKKGWFGVRRKAAWGTGSKVFLRELFQKKHSKYSNFFNDILEPLFYEALADGERTDDYYRLFDCYIPFLNGGLFGPLNNYDWVHTDILIPDELFSNVKKTKQGDTGTGILDVFDRYNFTVKEDEPLEKEVAIDPEMLGKVFENLLEVKDRKSKGTYYTPREIVHYMCQESLINYLATELKEQVKREDIETLIKHGETALENDALVSGQGEETGRYKYKLPTSIREHNKHIDRKLAKIKVCDPAVGSGAFLVGMMSEIAKTRSVLARLSDPNKEPNIYNFKRDAIQDSLHGVDIDLGAVEIAKLRLWLSLIVDEENYKHIKPLPNLDYKIMQGNSLLEEYEGIKLIDERFFQKQEDKISYQDRLNAELKLLQYEYIHEPGRDRLSVVRRKEIEARTKEIRKQLKASEQPQSNGQDPFDIFGQTEAQSKARTLLDLHERFFNAYHKSDKDRIHKQISELTWDLIETTLKQKGKEDKLEEVKRFQKTNTRPFFLWRMNFADVFHNKEGFDVVIANPPYVSHVSFPPSEKKALSDIYSTFKNRADLYVVFYEKGVRLLKGHGTLAFISPNKFFRSGYGIHLRRFLNHEARFITLVDFGDTPIFEATTYPCITILQKERREQYEFKYAELRIPEDLSSRDKFRLLGKDVLSRDIWSFAEEKLGQVLDKMKDGSLSLGEYIDGAFYRGVVTGFNEAFIITEEVKNKLTRMNSNIARIVKPYLMGKHVKRWSSKQTSYILYTFHGIDIENYPEVLDHLRPHKSRLEKRATSKNHRWYELQQPQVGIYSFYERPKIISTDIARRCEFTFDNSTSYIDATLFCIPIDDKYLLALLNSRLFEVYYRSISSTIRGGYLRFKKIYVEQLPVKMTTETNRKQLIGIVDKILDITKDNDYLRDSAKQAKVHENEEQIDQLVYRLYDLTPEEIATVEGSGRGG